MSPAPPRDPLPDYVEVVELDSLDSDSDSESHSVSDGESTTGESTNSTGATSLEGSDDEEEDDEGEAGGERGGEGGGEREGGDVGDQRPLHDYLRSSGSDLGAEWKRGLGMQMLRGPKTTQGSPSTSGSNPSVNSTTSSMAVHDLQADRQRQQGLGPGVGVGTGTGDGACTDSVWYSMYIVPKRDQAPLPKNW